MTLPNQAMVRIGYTGLFLAIPAQSDLLHARNPLRRGHAGWHQVKGHAVRTKGLPAGANEEPDRHAPASGAKV